MCGIAGFFGKTSKVPASTLEAMTSALSHRGPDDQGFFGITPSNDVRQWKKAGEVRDDLTVGLGFRRLAILDLSLNGAQPMTTPDGRYTLIFNGQIYNYIELRRELADVQFKSTSDTEVLLHMLARHGKKAFEKFNGIFALALWDRETRSLLIARDPLGVKPVYYTESDGAFFFASEIRSLLQARGVKPGLRRDLVLRYLANNWIPDPDTLFEGVFKLPPGHWIEFSADGKHRTECYWDMNYRPEGGRSKEGWLGELDSCLSGAVERQMRSDVPVGFFLSGGVDSSLLAARAVSVQKNPPTTFTIGFQWAQSSESQLDLESARFLKDKFPFQYNEILLAPSIVSLLPKVIETLEEPINDPAAMCSYLICEAASKKNYKVLISGQGGDEIFGGYHVYPAGQVIEGASHLPKSFLKLMENVVDRLPYSINGKRFQSVHRAKKVLSASQQTWPEPFFLLRSPFRLQQLEEVLNPDIFSAQKNPFGQHNIVFEKARDWNVIHQMMYLDTKTYLPSLNLTYSDKTSMHHSVELRVPLLDLELVRLMERVPVQFKSNLTQSKILLKALAERTLPKEIVHRKKTGFGLPIRDWFLNDLKPMTDDLLGSDYLAKQGLLNPAVVQRWISEHSAMKADHGMKLYSLMTLQLWLRQQNTVS